MPSVSQTQSTRSAPNQQAQTQSTETGSSVNSAANSSMSSGQQSQQCLVGNQAIAAKLGVNAEKTPRVLPTPLPGEVGTVTYYKARYRDYRSRHDAPPPPDYYLAYGDKYANRFTTTLRPTLSPVGQKWVDRTFVLLQQAMENRLLVNRTAFDDLELDTNAFKQFAYGTHSKAYIDGGLSTLPASDLLKISTTPDLGDLATMDGVSQIIETGAQLVPQWGEQLLEEAEDTGEQVWDWATDW